MNTIKRRLAMAAILAAAAATALHADAQGNNWRAYVAATGISPGGWVTERAAAMQNACRHKAAFPGQVVSLQRVGAYQSWSDAQTVISNVSC